MPKKTAKFVKKDQDEGHYHGKKKSTEEIKLKGAPLGPWNPLLFPHFQLRICICPENWRLKGLEIVVLNCDLKYLTNPPEF